MLTIPLIAECTEDGAASTATKTQALIDSGVMVPLEDPEGKRIGIIHRVWADSKTVYGELEMPYSVMVESDGMILHVRTVRVWLAVKGIEVGG